MVWVIIGIILWIVSITLMYKSRKNYEVVKADGMWKSYWHYLWRCEGCVNFFGGWGAIIAIIYSCIIACCIYGAHVSNSTAYYEHTARYTPYMGLLTTSKDLVNDPLYEEILEYNKTVTRKRAEQNNWDTWIWYPLDCDWNMVPLIQGIPEAPPMEES